MVFFPQTVETEKVNGTNGVHKEGTNGNEEKETNGTNGTEEKNANGTNGTEDKTKGEAVVETAPEKIVSPIKKVVTEEGGAGDAAPKEVAAE
jgi:hypothetical protein